MTFILNINTDNAAFEDDSLSGSRNKETARILLEVARRLIREEDFSFFQTLRDINGNDVGRAAFKEGVRIQTGS